MEQFEPNFNPCKVNLTHTLGALLSHSQPTVEAVKRRSMAARTSYGREAAAATNGGVPLFQAERKKKGYRGRGGFIIFQNSGG